MQHLKGMLLNPAKLLPGVATYGVARRGIVQRCAAKSSAYCDRLPTGHRHGSRYKILLRFPQLL